MDGWTDRAMRRRAATRLLGKSRSLIYDRRVFSVSGCSSCWLKPAELHHGRPRPVLTRCRRLRQPLSPSLVCRSPSTRRCHLSAQSCRRYTSGSGAELESRRATPTRRQLRSRDRNSSAVPTFACTRTCVGRRACKTTLRRRGGLPPVTGSAALLLL